MMKPQTVLFPLVLLLAFCACQFAQVFRPLRLYNLTDGRTLEVFLQTTARTTGTLVSAKSADESFQGEFVIYSTSDLRISQPYFHGNMSTSGELRGHIPEDTPLAEIYGFGKETTARPVGSAILVGSKGTVIEIVFYKVAPDLRYGDGVARDNKGFYYRVFLSEEIE